MRNVGDLVCVENSTPELGRTHGDRLAEIVTPYDPIKVQYGIKYLDGEQETADVHADALAWTAPDALFKLYLEYGDQDQSFTDALHRVESQTGTKYDSSTGTFMYND